TGEEAEARGELVVNASGPWLDAVERAFTGKPERNLRLTRGVHFAAPPAVRNALVLFSNTDGRLFFVLPWLGYAWVGTTDTDFTGDLDAVRATGDDVRYLRDSARPILPQADWETIYFTTAGVRALVRDDRPYARESDVSRKHRIVLHAAAEGLEGLISVLGGKLTAYRGIAEEVVDAVVRMRQERLAALAQEQGMRRDLLPLPPCRTAARPLPGGDFQAALSAP